MVIIKKYSIVILILYVMKRFGGIPKIISWFTDCETLSQGLLSLVEAEMIRLN